MALAAALAAAVAAALARCAAVMAAVAGAAAAMERVARVAGQSGVLGVRVRIVPRGAQLGSVEQLEELRVDLEAELVARRALAVRGRPLCAGSATVGRTWPLVLRARQGVIWPLVLRARLVQLR